MYDAPPRVVMPVFSRGDTAEDTRRNLARQNLPPHKYTISKLGPSLRRASFIPASYYIQCFGTADSGQLFPTRYDAREIRHVRFFSVCPSAQAR